MSPITLKTAKAPSARRVDRALMPKGILLSFHRDEHNDILAVADWGQRLSFYQLSGKQVNVSGPHSEVSPVPSDGTWGQTKTRRKNHAHLQICSSDAHVITVSCCWSTAPWNGLILHLRYWKRAFRRLNIGSLITMQWNNKETQGHYQLAAFIYLFPGVAIKSQHSGGCQSPPDIKHWELLTSFKMGVSCCNQTVRVYWNHNATLEVILLRLNASPPLPPLLLRRLIPS